MSDSTTSPAGIPSPTDTGITAALARWVAAADADDPEAALAAIVALVADAHGLDVSLVVDGIEVAPSPAVLQVEVAPGVVASAGPWLPGFAREALLPSADRRRGGVHHTSPALASTVTTLALRARPWSDDDVVIDPAVGGGAFLLAAVEAMEGDRASAIARVRGFDVDPLAVAVTTAALRLWAGGADVPPGALRVGDALDGAWPFDSAACVFGNPPFLSQLRSGTARDETRRRALATRWPELAGYVDDAAAFLLAGLDHVVDGGVVALVQPASFLSARDAEPVRRRLRAQAAPVGLWIDDGRQFTAAVDTVALVVRKGAPVEPVDRARGVPATRLPAHPLPDDRSWGSLLLIDTPTLDRGEVTGSRVVADVANVTAGFRDQFYGLRGAVGEARAGEPRLITSGLIDPLTCRWGEAPCRFDKQRWTAPTVDPEAVEPGIRGWLTDRLVPKLVVASQTRVLEAAIDADGDMVPCTPVISVEPHDHGPTLGHLAAALISPASSLLLLRDAAGSALSSDAMRVSATAIGRLPLPEPGPAWDAAAAAIVALEGAPTLNELGEIGRLALAAHGLAHRHDILDWWHSRLRGR